MGFASHRLSALWKELGLDLVPAAGSSTPLAHRAVRVLMELGAEKSELDAMSSTAIERANAADALGLGLGLWLTNESMAAVAVSGLEKSIATFSDVAGKWTDFVVDNWHHPLDTWDDAEDLAEVFLKTLVGVPDQVIDITLDAVETFSGMGTVAEKVEQFADAMDFVEILDGLWSFGLTIAVSRALGNWIDESGEKRGELLKAELAKVNERAKPLTELRILLAAKVPAPALVRRLGTVPELHWGF